MRLPSRGAMRARCWSVALTLVALAAVQAAAQQRPVETFRSGREVLLVDASVHDANGRPLTDLGPSDFSVRIAGETRRVLTAHLYASDAGRLLSGVPAPRFTRTVDAPLGRVVLFAIDRDSIRVGTERPLIETAAKMLDALSPADAVAAVGIPG